MKKVLNMLFLTIFGLFLVVLASCKTSSGVTGSMTLTTTATTISVKACVSDPNNKVNSSSVRASYQTVDEDGELGSSSYVSFSNIPTTDENGDFASETQTIKNLKMDTTYRIKLYVTVGSNVEYLDEQDIKTTTDGTSEENPIKITNKEEFLNIVNDTDAYYSLEADIDLGSTAQSALFNSSTSFTGTFNGNNHKIIGFKQTSGAQYEGLFGYLGNGATVKDLIIETPTLEVSRSGTASFGVLAGYNDGRIINCSVTDATVKYTLSTTSATAVQHAAGLVGENDVDGIISNSSFNGTINVSLKSRVNFGGLVGNNIGTVTSSYANGDFTVDLTSTSTSTEVLSYNAGGFVGSNNGIIINSYSEGNLSCIYSISTSNTARSQYLAVNIGGFAGSINSGTIQNSVANMSIGYTSYTAAVSNVGLFAGLTSTNLSSVNAIAQNTYVGTDNTITLDLMQKDSDWKIKVTNEDEDSESSGDETIEIDRKFSFGFTNFLKKEDGTKTDFENQYDSALNYLIICEATLTKDEITDDISEIPYEAVIPASGYTSYDTFKNLNDFIKNYLDSLSE